LPPSLSGTDSPAGRARSGAARGRGQFIIPLTGSMDVLTIWLAARHHEPWPYYAFMATLGAVIGGYITYALARKGGKETMERKLSKRRAAKVARAFERWGFFAVAIPACCHRVSFVPFLIAAGAGQYSPKNFSEP